MHWVYLLLNTVILLGSGVSVTYGHHSILIGDRNGSINGLAVTVVLAVLFTCIQLYEYVESSFNISDGIYGSVFYMLTGFHGFHVILGTIMLSYSLWRVFNYEITREHHLGVEASIWYWHFVDVVWIGLFILVYYW